MLGLILLGLVLTISVNNYLNKGFQEAERKIPLNYASRYTSRSGGLQRSAYLPFKVFIPVFDFILLGLYIFLVCCFIIILLIKQVNSSGVMPIIFSTSSLALPGTLARFTGISALKKAAVALNPGGKNCDLEFSCR